MVKQMQLRYSVSTFTISSFHVFFFFYADTFLINMSADWKVLAVLRKYMHIAILCLHYILVNIS